MEKLKPISICICTYNRCDQLKKTLESLSERRNHFIDGDEILIIDNNSSDQTKDLVSGWSSDLPLVYHFESQQGLSVARNKGVAEFVNDVIIFIDDDISVTESFIHEYRKAVQEYPDAGFFGGKIHVDWQGNKPSWYQSSQLTLINGLIGYYDQGDRDVFLSEHSLLPYGANFSLTRNTLNKVGLFDQCLGVKGTSIARGEESDYFVRALEVEIKGVYLSNALVLHRFQLDRISIRYLYNYGVQKGIAEVILGGEKPSKTVQKLSYQLFAGLYQLLKNRRDRFYQCVINVGLIMGIQQEVNRLKK